tara:strand:- start:162 stop:605 length:444 start_codon:yes stop_codon:yes gene_type:complete
MSRQLYKTIDEKLKGVTSICSKGCSACCYQQIEVTSFEKEIVKMEIENLADDFKKDVTKDLNTWLAYFDDNTPNRPLKGPEVFTTFNIKAAGNSLKCPMLQNNECSIYEMRPATCRVHFVTENVDLCTSDRLRMSAPLGTNPARARL